MKLLTLSLALSSIIASLPATRWLVNGVRVKLFPEEEPSSAQVYNNYRRLFVDEELIHLEAAQVLQDHDIAVGQKVGAASTIDRNDFKFNSSKYLEEFLELQYFIPYDERAALQVYDDPRERDLAAGPQVSQDICGLHLDYMNHLAQKYRNNIVKSSEYSIFKIMETFDWPHYGLSQGLNIYTGDYQGCLNLKLNVMREELGEVDKSMAEQLFDGNTTKQETGDQSYQWLKDNFGPFIGLPKQSQAAKIAIRSHRDHLRALPMRYCLAKLRWPTWSNSSYHRRNIAVRTAVCLPETCDSNSFKLHGDKIKRLTDLQSNPFYAGYYISDLYCLPDEKSELRDPFNYTNTTLFILFNVVWISLTIVASFLSANKSSFLDSWSIRKNLSDFMAGKKGKADQIDDVEKVDLKPLEGLKVFGAMMVICAHAYGINMGATWNSARTHEYVGQTYIGSLLVICPISVDIFFVLTGIITSYLLFNNNQKSLLKPTFWISFVVYRYIRIVPLYALVHWFLNSTFRFIGSGPLWDYGTSHTGLSKICQDESWWDIIFPSANFKSPNRTCNTVGWYLANDVQFTLITPLIVALYATKPRLGHLVTGSTILMLVANHIRYYMQFAEGSHNVFKWDMLTFTSVFHDTTDGYVNPQYRVVSYLIGLATGYLLYEYGRNSIREWPQSFLVLGKLWLLFTAYLLSFLPFISTLVPLDNKPFVQLLAPTLLGTMHAVASISAAIFTLFICTGHLSDQIRAVFCWPGFKPIANASLSIVLVQVPLILYHTQSLSTLPELTHHYLLSSIIIWSFETVLLASVVHVLYEIPIRRFLVKSILKSLQQESQVSKAGTTANGKIKES